MKWEYWGEWGKDVIRWVRIDWEFDDLIYPQSILTHLITSLPHSHQFSHFIIYHTSVIPFFRILTKFSLHYFPSQIHFSSSFIQFFPTSFLPHSFIFRMCARNTLLGIFGFRWERNFRDPDGSIPKSEKAKEAKTKKQS